MIFIRKYPIKYHISLYDTSRFLSNNQYVIIFTTNDIIYKFYALKNHKLDALYLTKTTRKEFIQVLYEYWYE